ncbi:MAG: C10 family peptidase [Alistipes sp.]|nr:C10 family peptidase [Alistipes sp.]
MRTFVLDHITRSNVKIDLPDTLVYIVDFDNGDGYAILGAQYDISPIFSITENGTFDTDKFAEAIRHEVKNNIITLEECEQRSLESVEEHDLNHLSTDDSFVYELMASYVIDDAIDGPIILDPTPVTPPITPPSLIRTTTYTTMEIVEHYPPLLTTTWHQWEPFNLKCENDESELCPTGCTVTALAQIIAYHEYPQNLTCCGVPISWDVVKGYDSEVSYTDDSDTIVQLSCLCRELGKSNYCDVNYTPTGSSSNATKAKNAFEELKYKNVDKRLGFEEADISAVINMIKKNKPVYVGAHKTINNGHAMVYDGYVKRRPKTTTTCYFSDGSYDTTITYGSMQNLFHIAWGYTDGLHNGYYLATNEIDSNKRYAQISDKEYTKDTDDPDLYRYYDRYFRIITYNL